jgi:hypothetical protein
MKMRFKKCDTRYPQPIGMFLKNIPKLIQYHNADWRKPPVNVHYCILELGEFYWIRRAWISEELIQAQFLQITPKGYGFLKEDGTRIFKRPMYPNKLRSKAIKPKLLFCIHQNITIYKPNANGAPTVT